MKRMQGMINVFNISSGICLKEVVSSDNFNQAEESSESSEEGLSDSENSFRSNENAEENAVKVPMK